jgi:hypothetical protein
MKEAAYAFVFLGIVLIGLALWHQSKRNEAFSDLADLNYQIPASTYVRPNITKWWYDDWKEVKPGRVPEDNPDFTAYSPNKPFARDSEMLLMPLVPALSVEQAEAMWDRTSSEVCYREDAAEPLKKTRNFLQRTNNYPRTYPDSCSAPNHELIGTFYAPPNAIGQKPPSGLNYPPSTQCAGAPGVVVSI